jgi:hypothetical protein
MTEYVEDTHGREIKVGSRVVAYSYNAERDKMEDYFGVVTEITDGDADYDDDAGRGVYYPPQIKVKFDSGEEDSFACQHEYGGPDREIEHTCEDIDVVVE